MEGSTGDDRILVRTVFVVAAIRAVPRGAYWVAMQGVHVTLAEFFANRGVKATIPFLEGDKPFRAGEQDPQIRPMVESDLIMIEGSYSEPELMTRIEAAKRSGKPIVFLRQESSKIQNRIMFDEAFRWVFEYRNYIALSRELRTWFDTSVRTA